MDSWDVGICSPFWAPIDLALKSLYFDPLDRAPFQAPPDSQRPVNFQATDSVLNTIELLERILENCLFHDLLIVLPRVSKTWKHVIDNNSYIQKGLFFTPWGPKDYQPRYLQINPYIKSLAYDETEMWPIGRTINLGPAAKQTEQEDTDDAEEAGWLPDPWIQRWHAFDWPRIEADPRFMYEKASWRRMLPIQPPKRTIWQIWRAKVGMPEQKLCRSIRQKGQLLGEIYEDIAILEKESLCSYTFTFVRSSERFGAMMQVDINIEQLGRDDERIEVGTSSLYRIRGGVRWMDRDLFPGKVYYDEWGNIPWLAVGEEVEESPEFH